MTACDLLLEERRVIRQTLDFPLEAMSGPSRNGLLTMHAIRLRQLEAFLGTVRVARHINVSYG